ncbi:uncharacterized protein LOC131958595 [Physella acuta]|uniref:uncharacterized protein LOC131958595 n=1 Tax=Physella acuta TaxID=109671 RepID=UPI0027DD0A15|nr:uncharacterized protein LOC131958595 [Physella acuta]
MLLYAAKLFLFIILTGLSNGYDTSKLIESQVISQLDGYRPACEHCIKWRHTIIVIFGSIFHPDYNYMRDNNHFFQFEFCPYEDTLRHSCATNRLAWQSYCYIRWELIHHDCKLPLDVDNDKCNCQYAFPQRLFVHLPVELLKGKYGPELVFRLRYGPPTHREETWDMRKTIKMRDILASGHVRFGLNEMPLFSTNFAAVGYADLALVLATAVMALVLSEWYGVIGE